MLVTILVGLDAIESGDIKAPPKELRAAWNPKDKTASSRRSRRLVLEMTLIRAVDALDAYISWSRRKPSLIQNADLRNDVDESGNRILNKFLAFQAHYSSLDPVTVALTEFMIAWRNRSVHSLAKNDITKERWELLNENGDKIALDYRGLEVERLLEDFDANKAPTFKETASMIQVAHNIVGLLEIEQFKALNETEYLRQLICADLEDDTLGSNEKEAHKKRRISSIWGRDKSDRHIAVMSYLKNLGLSDSRMHDHSVEFEDDVLVQLSELVPKKVIGFLGMQGEV